MTTIFVAVPDSPSWARKIAEFCEGYDHLAKSILWVVSFQSARSLKTIDEIAYFARHTSNMNCLLLASTNFDATVYGATFQVLSPQETTLEPTVDIPTRTFPGSSEPQIDVDAIRSLLGQELPSIYSPLADTPKIDEGEIDARDCPPETSPAGRPDPGVESDSAVARNGASTEDVDA